MRQAKFAFEKGKEKRLKITWRLFWKDCHLYLDQQEIAVIPDLKSSPSHELFLPDGSLLKLKVDRLGLHIFRNDQPLPGSLSDPAKKKKFMIAAILYFILMGIVFSLRSSPNPGNSLLGFVVLLAIALPIFFLFWNRKPTQRLKGAYLVLFIFGGLQILFGSLALFSNLSLASLDFGWPSLILGTIFLFLGVLVKRKLRGALMIATLLYCIPSLLYIWEWHQTHFSFTPTFILGLVIRGLLFLILLRGFGVHRSNSSQLANS